MIQVTRITIYKPVPSTTLTERKGKFTQSTNEVEQIISNKVVNIEIEKEKLFQFKNSHKDDKMHDVYLEYTEPCTTKERIEYNENLSKHTAKKSISQFKAKKIKEKYENSVQEITCFHKQRDVEILEILGFIVGVDVIITRVNERGIIMCIPLNTENYTEEFELITE
jgi:hypothetical protein